MPSIGGGARIRLSHKCHAVICPCTPATPLAATSPAFSNHGIHASIDGIAAVVVVVARRLTLIQASRMPPRSKKKKVSNNETMAVTKARKDVQNNESVPSNEGGDTNAEWEAVRTLDGTCGTLCRMDGCQTRAIVVWSRNNNSLDEWPVCQPCQETKFDPDSIAHFKQREESKAKEEDTEEALGTNDKTQLAANANVVETMNDEKKEGEPPIELRQNAANPKSPAEPEEATGDPAANDEEKEEQWHMKKIMNIADLNTEAPIKCGNDDCLLPAAVLYVSDQNSLEWYTCLDCQVSRVLCSTTEFASL